MGSSGGGRKPNQGKLVQDFIKTVQDNQEIDDITKNELITGAQGGLGTLQDELKKNMAGGLAGSIQASKANQKFGTSFKGLQTEFEKAKLGTDPNYRYRMFTQRKNELLSDRPGRMQTILSKKTSI